MYDLIILDAVRQGSVHPLIVCFDCDQVAMSNHYFDVIDSCSSQFGPMMLLAGPVHYGYRGFDPVGLPLPKHVPDLFLFNMLNQAINRCLRGYSRPGATYLARGSQYGVFRANILCVGRVQLEHSHW